MSKLLTVELLGLLKDIPEQKVLRFSSCDAGYAWSSMKVGDRSTMQVLLWLWNHRERIAQVLETAESLELLQACMNASDVAHTDGCTIFTLPDDVAERIVAPAFGMGKNEGLES